MERYAAVFVFDACAKKGIPKMDFLYKTNTGSYDLPSSTLISTGSYAHNIAEKYGILYGQMKDL